MNFVLKAIKKYDFVNRRMGYLLEIVHYTRAKFQKKYYPSVKFVIFGTGRSGSTLLVDLLHSNPNIHCDNELFHRRLFAPLSFLECRSRMFPTMAYGFKCLTYQIYEVLGIADHQQFITNLQRLGYKIIYLRREDTFRQALSNIYARQRNIFHTKTTSETSEQPKIVIDLEVLDDWMQRLDAQKAFEKNLLKHIPHFEVFYEKDLIDPLHHNEVNQKICTFLGVPHTPAKTHLKKISPTHLDDYIENLQEVKAHISSMENKEI